MDFKEILYEKNDGIGRMLLDGINFRPPCEQAVDDGRIPCLKTILEQPVKNVGNDQGTKSQQYTCLQFALY